ncbi:hypothetical protein MVEG_06303 [Podila verticillata NRRL 6337]|nr:MAG: hypothetical protein BYD32DRAFT_486910 [Podila humilis]KFH67571.1 hypothetical protein MVEG_06303 [Podila verticillata NRRL 6337]
MLMEDLQVVLDLNRERSQLPAGLDPDYYHKEVSDAYSEDESIRTLSKMRTTASRRTKKSISTYRSRTGSLATMPIQVTRSGFAKHTMKHPNIAHLFSVGRLYHGRDRLVSRSGVDSNHIIFHGRKHPREYVIGAVVEYLTGQLLRGQDPQMARHHRD